MRHLKFSLFILFLSSLLLFGCKKIFNSPQWDSDALVPIAKTDITIEKIIPAQNRYADSTNTVHLTYSNEIFNFSLEEDYVIPDTSYVSRSGGFGVPLNIFPGQIIVSDTSESTYNLPEANFLEAGARGGYLILSMEGTLEGDAIVEYILHSAEKDGKPLTITTTLPASTNGVPTKIVDSISIADYELNLRGTNQNKFNTMSYSYKVTADPNGSTVRFKPSDYVEISNSLKGLVPWYARGYFIQRTVKAEPGQESFNVLGRIKSGTFDAEYYDINLTLENSLGFDVSVQMNDLILQNTNESSSKALNHPIIGQHVNLTRADEILGDIDPPVSPTKKVISMDETNSNIFELLSLQPNMVNYDIDISINPLGNISNNKDFLYTETGLRGMLDVDLPLSLSIEGLEVWDTTDAKFSNNKVTRTINSDALVVYANNSLPFSAGLELVLLDEGMQELAVLGTNQRVASAEVDEDGVVIENTESEIRYNLDEQAVDAIPQTKFILFKSTINKGNSDYVKIFSGQGIALKVVADFNYTLGQDFEE